MKDPNQDISDPDLGPVYCIAYSDPDLGPIYIYCIAYSDPDSTKTQNLTNQQNLDFTISKTQEVLYITLLKKNL